MPIGPHPEDHQVKGCTTSDVSPLGRGTSDCFVQGLAFIAWHRVKAHALALVEKSPHCLGVITIWIFGCDEAFIHPEHVDSVPIDARCEFSKAGEELVGDEASRNRYRHTLMLNA